MEGKENKCVKERKGEQLTMSDASWKCNTLKTEKCAKA